MKRTDEQQEHYTESEVEQIVQSVMGYFLTQGGRHGFTTDDLLCLAADICAGEQVGVEYWRREEWRRDRQD